MAPHSSNWQTIRLINSIVTPPEEANSDRNRGVIAVFLEGLVWVFFLGILGKMGVLTWCFDVEVVVECMVNVGVLTVTFWASKM